MKKFICTAFVAALFLSSCSSSDSSSSATDESDVLVTKTVETYANDGSVITTNYTYNGKKIVQGIDSDGTRTAFTYSGDLITQIRYYDEDDVLAETETFSYDANSRLITYVRAELNDDIGFRETYVYNSDGTVTSTGYTGDAATQDEDYSTGTIHLSGGEVTAIENTSSFFTTTFAYTYDTKNSPFKNVTGYDKVSFVDSEATGIHHNILTENRAEFGNTYLYTTTYTYNSLNFPTTASEIEGTDATSVITTQYTYN